jgi:aspartate 1-decarboxylase
MLRKMLHGKLHRLTVTETHLDYEGSIGIDRTLIDAAGMLPHEMVQVFNVANGARFETYVIECRRDSGKVTLNGAAARCAQPGDRIIVVGHLYCTDGEERAFEPKIVHVDEANRITDRS